MFDALSVFATVLSVACAVLIQHVLVRFNKVEKSYGVWARDLSDDCNRTLQSQYVLLMDAAKNDILAFFKEYDEKLKNNDLKNDENDETDESLPEDGSRNEERGIQDVH